MQAERVACKIEIYVDFNFYRIFALTSSLLRWRFAAKLCRRSVNRLLTATNGKSSQLADRQKKRGSISQSSCFWAENGTRTRDLNLGKVALSSPQNATRLGVTNWAISFYDDFLECVLPCFSHWLNGWLNICVCLLVCKWLLIKELFNGLNKFCNTFFLVIHWHSEFIVFK